jgi:hypothetical protein
MKTKLISLLIFCSLTIANTFSANRYWVGGTTGTWNSTTASWSDTSGGTAGNFVPTSTDDVFFESGAAITALTLETAVTVNSITFTGRNVTFAGAFAITTTNMTVDNSQLVFVNTVNINSSLIFSGTTTTPRIKHMTTGNFQLGNGNEFTLTGNSATNYFEGTTSSSFRYNTTSALTVFFKASTTLSGIYVYKGLITVGNDLTIVRLNFPDANANNQELIIAPNVTLTLNSGGSSGFSAVTNGGTVNASARGSKFVMKSTDATILGGTKRIFKTGATINHFEFNSSGSTFNLFESIRVRNITKTAGTIATTASKTITVEAGGIITGAGTVGTDVTYESATTRYWVGGTSGSWLNAASWGTASGSTSTPGIPAIGDNVVFDNSAGNENPTVTLTEPVTAADINFASSNVTFAGAYSTTTNSMTVNSSQVQFVDHTYLNSALTLSGTTPRITQQSTTSGRALTFGNGGAFSLTGNSATNYFTGNTNAYYTFNTTSSLTVYFDPTTTTAGALVVTKGLITLGNDIKSNRLTLNSLNSQELILGENSTFTMLGGGTTSIVNTAGAGVVNASATGSKFVIASTAPTFLATAGRIFKDATTINHLEMNSIGQTFVPAYPLTISNLTLTEGTINNSTNNITIPLGGNLTATNGTTSAAVIASLPSAPTNIVATAGNAQVSVAFDTAPNGGSAILDYTVTSSPGGLTATGSASPLVVTGLTNGVDYTFTVTATNSVGTGAASAASNSVTPSIGTAVNDIQNFNTNVYVVNNLLIINHNSTVSANYSVNILHLNGQIAFAKSVPMAAGSNTIKIDINSLFSGVYFVQLQDGVNTLVTRKFIKK